MIHLLSSSSHPERAPSQRGRFAWRLTAKWVLAMFVLAVVASLASAPRRDSSERQSTATFAEPSFVHHELSEDDPPREPKHQESPAKKPRLKALLVQTPPATDPKQALAFYLCSGDAVPTPRPALLHTEPEPRSRREDPVLRLHPGQAPPHRVA
ncbi:hypothetical protein LJR143_000506 [Pseudoxanthomonas sp. LjRoot143]|uniref:hypothetical protein n=1 Tax=Pseudoxanthomonas sp. LjRoot143 TaxID=3342266 RepID=UPI003ECEF239